MKFSTICGVSIFASINCFAAAKIDTSAAMKLYDGGGAPESFTRVMESSDKAANLIFKGQRKVVKEGDTVRIERTVKYPDDKPAVVEEAFFKDEKVVEIRLKQLQLGVEGSAKIQDGYIHFSYTKEGKTKTDKEKVADNFVIGDQIYPYLRANWDVLMEGEDIDIRYPVLDRQETVGFKFFKVREEKRGEKDVVVVRMKPTSFIIAQIVDPLHFVFEKEGRHALREISGRTAVKVQKEGKWKDLDALTIYD